MAHIIITLKIMPENVEADLAKIENECKKTIEKYHGRIGKIEIKPVAFGLKSINITFSIDEKHGGTDALENEISKIENVDNAQVISLSRALG